MSDTLSNERGKGAQKKYRVGTPLAHGGIISFKEKPRPSLQSSGGVYWFGSRGRHCYISCAGHL